MIVTPLNERNLQLAAQVGVSDIVVTYPGLDPGRLREQKRMIEAFGLRMSHVERKIPHLAFVHDLPGRAEQVEGFKTLIRNMGAVGMEVLCYNWMPAEDWQRTSCDVLERGGAKVTEFDLRHVERNVTDAEGRPVRPTPAARLWENLERFLGEVVPVAEEHGIRLALHPDDPPLASVNGQDQIIISNEALRRVVDLVPSASNGLCYCVGSFSPAGVDLLDGIRRLADKIFFFHARNVRGTGEHFTETGMITARSTWRPWCARSRKSVIAERCGPITRRR